MLILIPNALGFFQLIFFALFYHNQVIFSTYMMNLFEQQTIEALLESGNSLIQEQKLIMETKLSKEYLKNLEDQQVGCSCNNISLLYQRQYVIIGSVQFIGSCFDQNWIWMLNQF